MPEATITADFGFTLFDGDDGWYVRWFVIVPMFGPAYFGEYVRVDQ